MLQKLTAVVWSFDSRLTWGCNVDIRASALKKALLHSVLQNLSSFHLKEVWNPSHKHEAYLKTCFIQVVVSSHPCIQVKFSELAGVLCPLDPSVSQALVQCWWVLDFSPLVVALGMFPVLSVRTRFYHTALICSLFSQQLISRLQLLCLGYHQLPLCFHC